MPHPRVDNRTPFVLEPLFITDESGRPLVVPIIKATYAITASGLQLADEQIPVDFVGQLHGKPGESSYRREPETAFVKVATDVVLVGHAYPPRGRATQVDVSLRVGPVGKTVRVFGDRCWKPSIGGVAIGAAEVFERMPLTFERAFGGWDRRDPDAKNHSFETRNPVGVGYHAKGGRIPPNAPLPNLEDPEHPIKGPHDAPPPACFGFVAPDWSPRCKYAGTYDQAWERERMPLLPADFDRTFFNAAAPGLIAPGYLAGGEAVQITNASPRGTVAFDLPTPPSLTCEVVLASRMEATLVPPLDTVIIDLDDNVVTLVWRASQQLESGPLDVVSLRAVANG